MPSDGNSAIDVESTEQSDGLGPRVGEWLSEWAGEALVVFVVGGMIVYGALRLTPAATTVGPLEQQPVISDWGHLVAYLLFLLNLQLLLLLVEVYSSRGGGGDE